MRKHPGKALTNMVLSCVLCSIAVNWVALPNSFVVTGITGPVSYTHLAAGLLSSGQPAAQRPAPHLFLPHPHPGGPAGPAGRPRLNQLQPLPRRTGGRPALRDPDSPGPFFVSETVTLHSNPLIIMVLNGLFFHIRNVQFTRTCTCLLYTSPHRSRGRSATRRTGWTSAGAWRLPPTLHRAAGPPGTVRQ